MGLLYIRHLNDYNIKGMSRGGKHVTSCIYQLSINFWNSHLLYIVIHVVVMSYRVIAFGYEFL